MNLTELVQTYFPIPSSSVYSDYDGVRSSPFDKSLFPVSMYDNGSNQYYGQKHGTENSAGGSVNGDSSIVFHENNMQRFDEKCSLNSMLNTLNLNLNLSHSSSNDQLQSSDVTDAQILEIIGHSISNCQCSCCIDFVNSENVEFGGPTLLGATQVGSIDEEHSPQNDKKIKVNVKAQSRPNIISARRFSSDQSLLDDLETQAYNEMRSIFKTFLSDDCPEANPVNMLEVFSNQHHQIGSSNVGYVTNTSEAQSQLIRLSEVQWKHPNVNKAARWCDGNPAAVNLDAQMTTTDCSELALTFSTSCGTIASPDESEKPPSFLLPLSVSNFDNWSSNQSMQSDNPNLSPSLDGLMDSRLEYGESGQVGSNFRCEDSFCLGAEDDVASPTDGKNKRTEIRVGYKRKRAETELRGSAEPRNEGVTRANRPTTTDQGITISPGLAMVTASHDDRTAAASDDGSTTMSTAAARAATDLASRAAAAATSARIAATARAALSTGSAAPAAAAAAGSASPAAAVAKPATAASSTKSTAATTVTTPAASATTASRSTAAGRSGQAKSIARSAAADKSAAKLATRSAVRPTDGDGRPNPERRKRKQRSQTQLWQFLLEILTNPLYNPRFIYWTDRAKGVFKFKQSQEVARLWTAFRQRSTNTPYEFLSRAMRYYYKRDILRRVPEGRLRYQFLDNAVDWRTYAEKSPAEISISQ